MGIHSPEGGNLFNIDLKTLRVVPKEQLAKHLSGFSPEGKVVFSSKPISPRSQSSPESGNIVVPEDHEAKKRRREKPIHPAISDPDFNKYRPRKRNQLITEFSRKLFLYILQNGQKDS